MISSLAARRFNVRGAWLFWLTGCIAVPTAGAVDDGIIDACAYADDAAARAAWVPMGGSAPVSVALLEGRNVLRLPCNFTGTNIERASWDRQVKLDLASGRGIQFRVLCRDASPVSYFSLYFQSGDGWYHGSFYPESASGWSTISLNKADMTVEGQPAGWGQIRTIRISAWRGQDINTEFYLSDLRRTGALGGDAAIAILRAESATGLLPAEARSVQQFTEGMARSLRELELECAVVSDLDITAARLKPAKVVILPHNPSLPEPAADELIRYVDAGGKLLVFYTVPVRLRPLLKVEGGDHIKGARAGSFSSLHFVDGALSGAPPVVGQQSWNISSYRPVSGVGHVFADWFDDQGKPAGYPAVLGSKDGLVMSHVLLPDDAANKHRLLLAMIGYLAPEIWQQAAKGEMAKTGSIGEYESFDEAVAQIRNSRPENARVVEALATARELRDSAAKLIADRKFPEAIARAAAARQKVKEAFCLAQRPLSGEFRAFWCHSAFGVQGMNWDEAIGRLANNGFTAILPNMLWGGAAFYASKVLPVAPQVAERGDQIAQCVAACRKHGVQVHVWKVNWNLGQAAPKEFVQRIRQEGRLQASSTGKEEPWLCPSHPENQALEIASMVEVARNYDVDGIHFDYIRYPDGDHCFCAGCKERFQRAIDQTVARWPADVLANGALREQWLDWRRSNITAVVKAVSQQARAAKPKIKISAAVFPNWAADRDTVGQDWKLWCESGYVDFVCPMDYTPSNRSFENLVRKQMRWASGTPCYPGIGVSASSSHFGVDRVIEQINTTRQHKTGGFTIFNYAGPESRELLPLLGLGITANPRSEGRNPK
ncbi:MAG TPA: family 10 glycosylhydrolase [Verrucomicrobiae bacterium]